MNKKIAISFLILFILFLSLCNNALAQNQVQVGISKGDIFNYDVSCSFDSTDPNEFLPGALADIFNQVGMQVRVSEVEGPLVHAKVTYQYKDGTEKSVEGSTNLETGVSQSISFFIVPSNLNAESKVFTGGALPTPSATINETISKAYLGENRETNHIFVTTSYDFNETFTQSTTSYDFFFDRITGMIVEHKYEVNSYNPRNSAYKSTTIVSFKINSSPYWTISNDVPSYFDVNVENKNYKIAAISNSSISNLSFDPSLKEIRFSASGETGTTGFLNILIPADLMWGDFLVYKDGTLLDRNVDYTQTNNGTYNLFQINYSHSDHTFSIRGSQAVPEFPSFIALPIVMATVLAGLIIYKKKLGKNL